MTRPVIGFAGLTHLGINSAVAAAAQGFPVVGYDRDPARARALADGNPPVLEPQLPELLAEHRDRLTFTSDLATLATCDVVYIAIDVPTNDQGQSDLTPIDAIIAEVTSVLRADGVLVVLCQVPPGFTRQVQWPEALRYYQVETLIFGRAIERATKPERFMVGCADPTQPMEPRLAEFLGSFGCPILPMRYESAELAKIAINMCLIASVSTANTLAEVCEQIGADWAEISPALKLDRRIGQYSYLSPGLGISGGNLERDLATVINLADEHETDGGVVRAWRANSQHRKDWPFRALTKLVLRQAPDAKVGVLGLTYKENTNSTKNSPAIELLKHLGGRAVQAFDPAAPAAIPGVTIQRVSSALDAARDADVLLVMTPWPEFKSISPAELAEAMRGRVVIDPYKLLDGDELVELGFTYAALGEPVRQPALDPA